MSKNNHDQNSPEQEPEKDGEPTRDANGHWLPGHCPNPKGRPRKQEPPFLTDSSDLLYFAGEFIDITINGETVRMDRVAAMRYRQYQSGMNGGVYAQRLFLEAVDKQKEQRSNAVILYDELLAKWYFNNRPGTENYKEVPIEVEAEIMALARTLNHYYPGSYPDYDAMMRNMRDHEDDDDDLIEDDDESGD